MDASGDTNQAPIGAENARFWMELCDTGLATSLGIDDIDEQSLRRFDEAYLATYPYLEPYADELRVAGKDVLEIGAGVGTLERLLVAKGANYLGSTPRPDLSR
jgi:hypothetical protein